MYLGTMFSIDLADCIVRKYFDIQSYNKRETISRVLAGFSERYKVANAGLKMLTIRPYTQPS